MHFGVLLVVLPGVRKEAVKMIHDGVKKASTRGVGCMAAPRLTWVLARKGPANAAAIQLLRNPT
jgi:hypothetical protein